MRAGREARAAWHRDRARRDTARPRRPPFLPPTGHFDNGDYAGVQLHVEDEVRVNNHAAVMLEKARQVTTTVDQNVRRPQRYQMARSGGAALMDCSMHFQGNQERAWPNIKPGDTSTSGTAVSTQWSADEILANAKRLRKVDLLQPLSGSLLHDVAAQMEYCEYWPGEPIINQGDPGDGVYMLLSGAAQAETGDGESLRIYGPGDIFGELALESDQPRSVAVRAIFPATDNLLPQPGGSDDFEDGSDQPAQLLKIPHLVCRRLRGDVGLRARLAKIRRGFGRPRSQYQGVQGSHMTLSESTPGAFGVSDTGAALRSIGVAEVNASEGAAQLQKRLDRGKLRPDLRLQPDEEAEIKTRLAKIEMTKSESLWDQGQEKIEIIASASAASKRAEGPMQLAAVAAAAQRQRQNDRLRTLQEEWRDRLEHVHSLDNDDNASVAKLSGGARDLACRVYSKHAGQWLLGKVVQYEATDAGEEKKQVGKERVTAEEGPTDVTEVRRLRGKVKVEWKMQPADAPPLLRKSPSRQPQQQPPQQQQQRQQQQWIQSGPAVVGSKWVNVESQSLEWPLNLDMPLELRLAKVNGEIERRAVATGAADVGSIAGVIATTGAFDNSRAAKSVEKTSSADSSVVSRCEVVIAKTEKLHKASANTSGAPGGDWHYNGTHRQQPAQTSRRLHKYVKAQGSRSDVQPHRGLYRKLSRHDGAIAVRRQRAELARGGSGTQYVPGVAGGADTVPSQVVEDFEGVWDNNRQQRREQECTEDEDVRRKMETDGDGNGEHLTAGEAHAADGPPLGLVVTVVSIGNSAPEGNTPQSDPFEDDLDSLHRYSNI